MCGCHGKRVASRANLRIFCLLIGKPQPQKNCKCSSRVLTKLFSIQLLRAGWETWVCSIQEKEYRGRCHFSILKGGFLGVMRTNTVYPWQVAKHLAISIKHSLGDSDWTSGKPFSLGGNESWHSLPRKATESLGSEVLRIHLTKAIAYIICCQQQLHWGWMLDPSFLSFLPTFVWFVLHKCIYHIDVINDNRDCSVSHLSLVAVLGRADCWQTCISQSADRKSLYLHAAEP